MDGGIKVDRKKLKKESEIKNQVEKENNKKVVWNTKKIEDLKKLIEKGDEKPNKPCFFESDIELKAPDLVFEYTEQEIIEYARCMQDIIYFSKYCKVMTDDGYQYVNLRDYQQDCLKTMQENRNVVFLASRQIGKCVQYDTNINIFNNKKNTYDKVNIGELYYKELSKIKKLNLFERLRWGLWRCVKKHKFKNIFLFIIHILDLFVLSREKLVNSVILNDIHIETDSGYQQALAVHITKPFYIWNCEFLNKSTGNRVNLSAADDHLLFIDETNCKKLKDLKLGDSVIGKHGNYELVSKKRSPFRVQMFDTTINSKKHSFFTNDLLSHNSIMSAIFIAWYICFHKERNIMVVANKLATTTEIINKIRTIIKGLPFFIKPGIKTNAVNSMKFDNGVNLYSQATTKTAAIGFTIHLLYADEFAHIPHTFIKEFYRSIYPTLSSSSISRIIITSTANGMNLFYDIYMGAVEGINSYYPLNVNWWQVPGRDEKWKQQEIANLGSEELFNQEYGNQFMSSSRLLLDSETLKYLKRYTREYIEHNFDFLVDYPDMADKLKFDRTVDVDNLKNERIILTIDLGDGVGRDYTVINIFKLNPLSRVQIGNIKAVTDESSFFGVKQIGLFRSNSHSVDEVAILLEIMCLNLFDQNRLCIAIEINFKGHILHNKLTSSKNFNEGTFLYTSHSIKNEEEKLGVRIDKNNREVYFRELRNLIKSKKIILTEIRTYEEISSFGVDKLGRYTSQLQNDDVAMSTLLLVPFFNSQYFIDMVEDTIDTVSFKKKREIERAIINSERDTFDDDLYNWLKENS
jgi:hypothetical protein